MLPAVKIYDTTLRDGAQTFGISFSLEDKLRLASELDNLGVHYIEGGWPGSNPKDLTFFEKAKQLRFNHAKLTTFSSTKRAGIAIEDDENIRQLIAAETPAVAIFGKSWDLHVIKALGISLSENIELIFETLRYLKSYFDEVIFDAEHFFDGYKTNPEYALQTLRAASEADSDWIVLCDTNGGVLAHECDKIIAEVKSQLDKPLGIHTHNDADLAVANTLIAVAHGATMVQGTINGLGERCGNANLCSVIPNLSLKQGIPTIHSDNIKQLSYISRLVSEIANQKHPDALPYVGNNAFAHKGGVHVSAVRKDSRTYEHIDPDLVGNERVISVSELSGKSNILEKAKEMGFDDKMASADAQEILKQIKELESQGYHFEGAEASLELFCKALLGQRKDYFTLEGFRVFIWKNSHNRGWSEATIKAGVPEAMSAELQLHDPVEHTSADGNGPVEALDRALRKVLEKFYPQLKQVKLIDYKVRILNEGGGTKAVTRVLINSTDGERKWGTVGVSDNIIEASWQALVDSLIYKLMKDDEEKESLS